jgi:uncharacterized protein YerC
MNTSKSLDEDVHHEDSGDAPISLHSIIPSSNNVEDEVTDRIFWEEFMNKAEAKFGAKAAKIARLHLDGMVQAEISKIVGISQAQVSRILKKIVNVYKQKEEGGIEMKITYDQLLSECREHGTGKEGQEIIAAKYGMTPGSVSVCIVRNGIVKKLKEEKKSISAQPEEQQISHANPDAQIIQVHKDPAPVTQSQSKHASTLKIKAWDGKENTYSFQDGKLVITNKEGVLPVVDINTMIAELQELADKKEAV